MSVAPESKEYFPCARPKCEVRHNGKVFNKTTGEKWMCKCYKTETKGQLSNADKAKRQQWRPIIRGTGKLIGNR